MRQILKRQKPENKFISAKTLSFRWEVDISTVHRKLAFEGITGIRLGERKGSTIRFPIEEIEQLEQRWREERP